MSILHAQPIGYALRRRGARAAKALTVCVRVLPAPSFAARLITYVFVDKNGGGSNDAGKEMVCGRWREPDGYCKGAWLYHVHIDSIADPEDGSEAPWDGITS